MKPQKEWVALVPVSCKKGSHYHLLDSNLHSKKWYSCEIHLNVSTEWMVTLATLCTSNETTFLILSKGSTHGTNILLKTKLILGWHKNQLVFFTLLFPCTLVSLHCLKRVTWSKNIRKHPLRAKGGWRRKKNGWQTLRYCGKQQDTSLYLHCITAVSICAHTNTHTHTHAHTQTHKHTRRPT